MISHLIQNEAAIFGGKNELPMSSALVQSKQYFKIFDCKTSIACYAYLRKLDNKEGTRRDIMSELQVEIISESLRELQQGNCSRQPMFLGIKQTFKHT